MTGEIYWHHMPLEEESVKMAKYLDPTYATALKKNVTSKFIKEVSMKRKSKQNLILNGQGRQRSGKSWQFIKINELIAGSTGDMIRIENCEFTLTELLKRVEGLSVALEKLKKQETHELIAKKLKESGEEFQLDEQISIHGYGSTVEKNMLDNIEMIVGKWEWSFSFLAPKYIPHNFMYHLETWEWGNWEKKIDPDVPVNKQWIFTKSIITDHRGYKLGYIVTSTPEDKNFLKKYETKKDKFLAYATQFKGSQRPKLLIDKCYELLMSKEKIYVSPISDFKENFLQRWIRCRNNNMKIFSLRVALSNIGFGMVGTDELKQMAANVDNVIVFEESIAKEALKLGMPRKKLAFLRGEKMKK